MIDRTHLESTVFRIGECMTYFPQSPVFKAQFADFLARLIGQDTIPSGDTRYTPEMRLEWLAGALIEDVCKWPEEGMKDVRGVYCCKFKPADGKEGYTALRGFAPEDIESGQSAACLGAPAPAPQFLPQPGDEPIGYELPLQIAAAAKRLGSGK